MTATSFGGWLEVPRMHQQALSNGFTTLDATTDYVAFVCKAPATGTIDKLHVRIGTTAVTGGNATLSCQVQTLDASGDPSGAAYGSSAAPTYAVTGTDDNTWVTFNSVACSATAGDYICVNVWLSAIVTTASVAVMTTAAGADGMAPGMPYTTVRTTGTGAGTKANAGYGPIIEYSGAVFHELSWSPQSPVTTETIDADGTIRKLGNVFTLPAPVTAIGAWVKIDNDTDTTSIKLWDTDGITVLATATLVALNRQSSAGRMQYVVFDGGTAVSLSAGSTYRIAAETNNTSSTAAGFATLSVSAAGWLGMLSMGSACHYTSHNGTAWSDTTTKRAPIGLLVSKIDDGVGQGRASFNIGV